MDHPVNAVADIPDQRDWIYRPSLAIVPPKLAPVADLHILNQHSEGACTGFALAAAINMMNRKAGMDARVSPRMLYEMAKRHDEWQGEDYAGSSLRGAIHGWKHMGVCTEDKWPYFVNPARRGDLTLERARDARKNTLGAYYRLRPEIAEYHAAINETGVVAVSAKVHNGWNDPVDGVIPYQEKTGGAHAFVLVGYDTNGFWIQNSWGEGWGRNGLALWTYEDWIGNVMDGWVFRPALPTPQIFGLKPRNSLLSATSESGRAELGRKPNPRREDIAGHFVHIDDGRFASEDRYWSSLFDVEETVRNLGDSSRYPHILIYGHGGLNSPSASARRIAAMKNTFKDNGIYPFHIMYDTGLAEELKDLLTGKSEQANERVGGIPDWLDRMTENLVRRPGTLIWEEMKRDAAAAFSRAGAGTDSLRVFLDALKKQPPASRKKIHLVGHSTGGILFAHLLSAVSRHRFTIESCHLLAPACSMALYQDSYRPVLEGKRSLKLKRMHVYNLRDELEQDDKVGSRIFYRKSLLYLVSNAFERSKGKPLLGMEIFRDGVGDHVNAPQIHYSNGTSSRQTRSKTHGGFDNDPVTMNHILQDILGRRPEAPFTHESLDY